MMKSGDTGSISSGGVLACLNLSIEECRGLIGEAEAEVTALARAWHSYRFAAGQPGIGNTEAQVPLAY